MIYFVPKGLVREGGLNRSGVDKGVFSWILVEALPRDLDKELLEQKFGWRDGDKSQSHQGSKSNSADKTVPLAEDFNTWGESHGVM